MPRTPGSNLIGQLAGRPVATYGLAAVSVALFLLGPASGFTTVHGEGAELRAAQQAYFQQWGVVPVQLWDGGLRAWTTPLTALFLHGNWFHLLGNVLFLLVFGHLVEERTGVARFLCAYLCVGYAATVVYAVAHPDSSESLVGASGAISGVLGAFLYLFPRARVTSVYPFLFFLPLRLPAWLVLVFWVSLQWLALRIDTEGPGVAHLAHVAGFALGFTWAWVWSRGRRSRVSTPAQATEGEART
ncbi:rhomboid family intramembrane serine protease [Streptomyces sp. XM4193]|uniref:rhomboid family intramembrane serine protease n=1 Tax=Streptomyces sp. XM4193 TaxID=2929782 RepID=UPI001FF71847|nr:rhomboid family intramembrane serine protease [Streptomyces sp. XM4193]MCK1796309.1 rhomboid family intramembrane serine protease [Streptomyces sp. XM4193]